jgi:adenine phosphoribosyltransferase
LDLKAKIREVPNFPKPGILFYDVTTLLRDAEAFGRVIHRFAEFYRGEGIAKIVGIESRGFILGAPVAAQLGAGFVPVRKPGKLPIETIGIEYALEYGTDRLEMDPGAVEPGQKVVIVDDLIATGGTALASAELLRKAGAVIEQALFVIDLPDLGGAERLRQAGIAVAALMEFEGD